MAPNILHEGQHTGEFLVSQANGDRSRETGILAQRAARYLDGTILAVQETTDGPILIDIVDIEEGTEGTDYSGIAGILYGNYDASAGPVKAVYVDSDAEVKDDLIRYPEESSEGGEKATVVAALRALGIKPR